MIVTTYFCDCCGAQSTLQAAFNSASIPVARGINGTALLCSPCLAASTQAVQSALDSLKDTRKGVVLP